MNKLSLFLTAGAAGLILAGCSASGVNPVSPSRVCNLSANVLQMNVGTANLFGLSTGTNVAVTYRQSASANCFAGNSGALVNTPTLTVPNLLAGPAGAADGFGSTILTGPAAAEIGTHAMTAIAQTPAATNNTAATATFGDDGGAFGLGLEPFNYAAALGAAGVAGTPATVFPYPVPIYDTGTPDINAFTPGGGPPAYNPANNTAATLAGFNGISEGFDVFGFAPAAGAFSLSVLVPANTGAVTSTATASITNAAYVLPTIPAATVQALPATYNAATGVLTFNAFALPAGVTQAFVQVTDIGPSMGGVSCIGATPANPVYYTSVLNASGVPASIPAPGLCSAAANTTASGAATDGDEFGVQVIGLDYNWYGASYTGLAGVGGLGVAAPSITGASVNHQANVTISPLTENTLPGGNVIAPVLPVNLTPLAIHRGRAR
jgi:hypothetical protein